MTWKLIVVSYLIILAAWILVRLLLGRDPEETFYLHDYRTCNCLVCKELRRQIKRRAFRRYLEQKRRLNALNDDTKLH